jgi:Amidohydrolase family
LLHPEQLADPHMLRVVPPAVLASLRDPAHIAGFTRGMVGEVLPFVPGRYRDLLGWLLSTGPGLRQVDRGSRGDLYRTQRSIVLLGRAGVPLVLGSDSGNWPMFPYFLHGPTTWRELRLLEMAGLHPAEVLAAATVNAARMLGIDQDVGTVEVGKAADLLVVADDPRAGVARALHTLRLTIRAGVARTPDAWIAPAPGRGPTPGR